MNEPTYEQLLAAVQFYAAPQNWGNLHYGTNAESVERPGTTPHLSFSYSKPMARDLGQRARSVLGQGVR